MSIEHNQTKRDEQNTNRIENVEIYDDNKKRILLNFLLRNISTTYSASTAGKIRLTDLNWWLCLSENSWIVFAILFGKFDWLCKPCLENLPKLIEPITQLLFFWSFSTKWWIGWRAREKLFCETKLSNTSVLKSLRQYRLNRNKTKIRSFSLGSVLLYISIFFHCADNDIFLAILHWQFSFRQFMQHLLASLSSSLSFFCSFLAAAACTPFLSIRSL